MSDTLAPKARTRGGNNKGTRERFGNIRKLPSGRFQASYQGPDGKRHNGPTTFQTKGDARKWLDMQSAAITEARWKPAPPPTKAAAPAFGVYAHDWLERRELKPRTRDEYRKMLITLDQTFSGEPIDAITPDAVREWYQKLDPSRPTHRAHLYALLRTILNTAVDEELLTVNPCRIRGAGRAKRARKIRPATVEEVTNIANAMPDRYRLMVLFSAYLSLRFGELTELRRSDIDMQHLVIRVRRGVTWVDGEPIVGLPKTDAGSRDVSLPPHLVPLLVDHLATHAEKGRRGLLFPAHRGGHLNHGTFYKHFRVAREAAGRPDLRLHDGRHSGAVWAAVAGATTRELMDRLGHTTVEMAMRYQHVADGRQAQIAQALSAMSDQTTPTERDAL